ncbi:MAG: DegT/DnrJ/EryC1/StrS family aminotransferase [Myxococcales bacterium]|nr:DegT/DnrJ/EryC1/StrS family aminotransferase [Myxococcales bacterium]MCB9532435.1 DegT/DnrJ/EryC1/StrS family aminotransferase [Myxococcales bacterium]MCB9533517.1 DegT/DnrJ/EryC1/StrS family aminotransferase [Myxococcales bacterium]
MKLAINGGTPVASAPPRVDWPEYDDGDRKRLIEVLESRSWGGFPAPAPRTAEFGAAFAARHGAKFGVGVTNGSVTLEVALGALDIQAGDEVIAPCYTWVATAACAVHMNAVPVLVDVDPATYCIDCDQVEAAITERTRAIIPVHLGANMADMDRLMAIADKRGIPVIEDCAHAHGAAWRGRGAGSIGSIGSFSFQSSKLMTAGEGGAVITSDGTLAQRLQSIVNCGRKEPGYDGFDGWPLGVNARMTEFQAAVLIGQLERLDEATRRRAEGAAALARGLAEVGGLAPLSVDERVTTRAAYQLVMRYDPSAFGGAHRDAFLRALNAEGIEAYGPFYVPLPDHKLFNAESRHWPMLRERYGDGIKAANARGELQFPVAARAAYDEAVWLHYPYLMAGQGAIDTIVEAVAKIRANAHELAV